MSETPRSAPSWWQTLPGILTGLAAIITAVTGLIVAFNHTTGNRGEEGRTSASSLSGGASTGSPAEPRSPATGGAVTRAQTIALPALNRVTLALTLR